MTTAKAGSPGQSPERPLAGVRVIEFGTLIAGPFCTRILAEFGAEVIRSSRPRAAIPFAAQAPGWNLAVVVCPGAQQEILTLDLKDARGVEIARRLIGSADILVENFRPGVMEKLGLGWEALHALNPRLVMVRLSGFRPDRADEGSARLRRDRRVDGRAALHHRLCRPATGQTGISIGDSIAALWAAMGR